MMSGQHDTSGVNEVNRQDVDGGPDQYMILRGLQALSADVRENWRASDYPADMQRERQQFAHAMTHAIKALGKIAALVDHADHDRLKSDEARQLADELPKLISDLVRCAARMAETSPVPIDFASAYVARASQLAKRWSMSRVRR